MDRLFSYSLHIIIVDDEYQQVLNRLSIIYNDFSILLRSNVEQFIDLKSTTGLDKLELTYLQELYCSKAEKIIPKKMAIQNLKNDVSDLEDELICTQQAMAGIER